MSSKWVRVRFGPLPPTISVGQVVPPNKLGVGGGLCFQSSLHFVIPAPGNQRLPETSSLDLSCSPPPPLGPHPRLLAPRPPSLTPEPVSANGPLWAWESSVRACPGAQVSVCDSGGGRGVITPAKLRKDGTDVRQGSRGRVGDQALGWKSEVSRCPLTLSSVTA